MDWRQIILGLVCFVIAIGTGLLLYSNSYSGPAAVVIFVVGLSPIFLFLFSDQIGRYLSAGDSISLSAGPFSVSYRNPSEEDSGSTITEVRTNYDLFLTMIRSRSPELENKLRMERPEDVDESIDYIVTVLERGLSNPITETVSILRKNLELIRFLETIDDGFSPVENFTDNEMRVEMDAGYEVIEEGARFNLYVDWNVSARGEERVFDKKVADVEMVEIESDNWCRLEVSNWNVDRNGIDGDIMNKDPRVKIDQSVIRTVPESGLEEAYDYLDEIPTKEQ